jgi:SAM-dependent methyltransferase
LTKNENSYAQFNELLDQIGDAVPDGAQYKRLSNLVLDFPEARQLARMDPFTPEYRTAAMDLYLFLRGRRAEGYVAMRDEVAGLDRPLPDNLWTDLVPWAFKDAAMVSEHVLSWGHILKHLNLPQGGSLLEYGPGSGQILLMVARLGYGAYGVDIDESSLRGIQAQAAHLRLQVHTECNRFGLGFADDRFDTILFYEAFHHAFDFEKLLVVLHERLKPGGRVVLCGEPVVGHSIDAVPYPWGPRLDGLSVFCMRRFGWMELGFTHEYFLEIVRRKGWVCNFHPFPAAGRATVYVLERAGESAGSANGENADFHQSFELFDQRAAIEVDETVRALRAELVAMRGSTSWRLTAPIRASKIILRRLTHQR